MIKAIQIEQNNKSINTDNNKQKTKIYMNKKRKRHFKLIKVSKQISKMISLNKKSNDNRIDNKNYKKNIIVKSFTN